MLVSAIKEAEKNTSGEIRIHIDETCKGDPMKQAGKIFGYLGMDRTVLHNGVLIYVACQTKVFAVIGDSGINNAVPHDFWNDVIAMMKHRFSAGQYAEGLAEAVRMTGEKLKVHFPYKEGDVNELPDEISFGTETEKENR